MSKNTVNHTHTNQRGKTTHTKAELILRGTETQAQRLCVQRSAALHGDLLYFCLNISGQKQEFEEQKDTTFLQSLEFEW